MRSATNELRPYFSKLGYELPEKIRFAIHPKIAQERLGHSTITTTLDLYSHVVDTMQNDAVAKLDSAFKAVIRSRPKLQLG